MWIKGLANTYFNGVPSNSTVSAFGFDPASEGFRPLQGSSGETFRPYSGVYDFFGQSLISGRLESADGSTDGYEVYTLDPRTGTVSLFADINPDGDSFFDLDKVPSSVEFGSYIIGISGGIRAEPIALRPDGSHTDFADFFENIDSLSDARFAGEFDNSYLMIADIDDVNAGRLIQMSPQQGRYWVLDAFDREVGNWSISNTFVVDDRLFAQIHTSPYGRELWELEDGTWTLVDDHAPGRAYGSPSHAFSQNGEHYFTAVNREYGRELFRLTPDGFELVMDFAPGRDSGATDLNDITYDGNIYMRPGSVAPDTIYRMDAEGNISEVTGIGPDESLPWPDQIIDFDAQSYRRNLSVGDNDIIYAIKDGVMQPMELPHSEGMQVMGFHGGTLYVSHTDPDHHLTLYALSADEQWVAIYENAYSGSGVPLPTVGGLSSVERTFGGDTWFGDNSNEIVQAPDEGGVILARGGHDILRGGTAQDVLSGGTGRDTLIGGRGDDELLGGSGSDRLRGNRGADTLEGGRGRDDLFGGSGQDTLIGGGGSDTLRGGGHSDVLDGDGGHDHLMGNRGHDTLLGGRGRDSLFGGSGNDELIGGKGKDLLQGGAGADVFVFNRSDALGDIITDFAAGQDQIQISGVDWSELTFAQVDANVVVSWHRGEIEIRNITVEQLEQSDFLF